MHITLSLCLPRDELSIPVVRHVIRQALVDLEVEKEAVEDICVAQTEACANVVLHSGPTDEYEVSVDIGPEKCVIRVIDTGRGFDFATLADGASPSAERGRGVHLMRALVDEVKFVSKPEDGTIVHLEKVLRFGENSIMLKDGAGN